MTTPRKPRMCARCQAHPVTRGHGAKYCDLCRDADPGRNHGKKKTEIIVKVDGEGHQDEVMNLVSLSYGREDGTSDSIWTSDPKKALLWLVDELSGEYDGKRQVAGAFHFNWDTAVLTKAFDATKMMLVHKAGARETNLLCDVEKCDYSCGKLHRRDPRHIEAVITEGGEGDVIAWDPESGLAIAATPKRRFYVEHRPEGDRYDGWRRVDIHDNGSAFVGGLERVIDTWRPELTEAQRSAIAWGKQARKDGFLHGNEDRIIEYSEAECVADARCTRKLIDMIRLETGIPIEPSHLFGSGSVAGQAFKFYKVPTRKDTHVEPGLTVCGMAVDDLARLTYFGGLIETPVVGRVRRNVDSEDINSAYPSHAIALPCMRQDHGHWQVFRGNLTGKEAAKHTVGHVLATWAVETDSTPPFVVKNTNLAVRQPLTGYRIWVTLAEYATAKEHFGPEVSSDGAVWWVQDCNCPNPLAFLERLYAYRLTIKDKMDVAVYGSDEWHELNVKQEAVKLIINSCYGKLAQQRPTYGKYTNLHYAAYITGATRAQLRRRVWRKEALGGTVVYQHTDSVKFIGAPLEDEGKALGAWGAEKPTEGMIIIQPGLAAAIGKGKSASRGCDQDKFIAMAKEWADENDLTGHPSTWSVLEVPGRRMISRRMALHRNKPELAGSFVDYPLKIKVNEHKRNLAHAEPLSGEPEAWVVPPVDVVPNVASLDHIREHQALLQRLIEQGEFDYEE